MDDVINKGSISTYLIVTEDASELRIDLGPAMDLLTLHTTDMNAPEIVKILANKNLIVTQ